MEVTAAVLAVVVTPRSRTSALASPALIEAPRIAAGWYSIGIQLIDGCVHCGSNPC